MSTIIDPDVTAGSALLIKQKIIDLFNKNVRGKKADSSSSNVNHDGKEGHWLEKQMGIAPNASNTPDLFGFEMKNHTTSKTTFGDYSANYYLYKDVTDSMDREDFLRIFGAPNILKNNRYSWSGKPTPKINAYNTFGQKLEVNEEGDIFAIYSYNKDQRLNKSDIVPPRLQIERVVVARWDAVKLRVKVERKFNKSGWFKCVKDKQGFYTEIAFGGPINFQTWIEDVRKGLIFFDSGMYSTNLRPYSQWRANNNYWESLIIERY